MPARCAIRSNSSLALGSGWSRSVSRRKVRWTSCSGTAVPIRACRKGSSGCRQGWRWRSTLLVLSATTPLSCATRERSGSPVAASGHRAPPTTANSRDRGCYRSGGPRGRFGLILALVGARSDTARPGRPQSGRWGVGREARIEHRRQPGGRTLPGTAGQREAGMIQHPAGGHY